MIKYSTTFLCQFQLKNSKHFTLFQLLTLSKSINFVDTQLNQTRWSYSILKLNQIRHNQTQHNISYIVISIIISYFKNFQYFLVTWKGKDATSKISEVHWGAQLPQHKNAHCRVSLQTFFLALTFEPKNQYSKTFFFLCNFYFKEKQSRLITKNTLSKNPKWYFMIFFFPAGSRSKPIHFN